MGIKQRKGERERKKSHLIKVKEQVLFLDSPAIFSKL